MRDALRLRHFSPRTEQADLARLRRCCDFHSRRAPDLLGAEHVTGAA